MIIVKAKSWISSRTVWFGLLVLAYGVQAVLLEAPLLGSYTEQALVAIGAVIVALRARTSLPLSSRPLKTTAALVEPPEPGD